MFLFGLFGKGNSQNEQEKCDRITFKIDLNDNVPQFEECDGSQYEIEEEISPSHPLYYQIFPKKEEHFHQYIATENDTLFGIALKLEISQQSLRDLNGISGNVYPGMTIKLPEGSDPSKLHDIPGQQLAKLRISQLLSTSQGQNESETTKYKVSYYAGLSGYIHGTITVSTNYVIFNPSLDNVKNTSRFTVERLLKFNAIVETMDIQDVTFLQIPEMAENQEPRTISVVQFMLYKVGNSKIEKKYKERLKQLKIDHKAIASMSFAIEQGEYSSKIGQQLKERVDNILKSVEGKQVFEGEQKSKLTNIPFFDIIHENIQPKVEENKQEMNQVIHPSAILGGLSEQSEIITNDEFSSLVLSFPVLYQLYNWTKVYSSTRDGSSFNTLLNKSKGVEPALLIIKQYKGYRFGAFLIESLQTGKTGRGQMFIFSFKDKPTPQIYTWTTKNEQFVVTEKDTGIGIGMGFKYGIFLKWTLDKGSSSSTYTFGNMEMLSKKQDFLVDQIELWGLDTQY